MDDYILSKLQQLTLIVQEINNIHRFASAFIYETFSIYLFTFVEIYVYMSTIFVNNFLVKNYISCRTFTAEDTNSD